MEFIENLTNLLLAILESGRNTKTFHRILRERELERYTKESVRVTLSRLAEKGYVEGSREGWLLTKKGRDYRAHLKLFRYIASPFPKNSPKKILLAFDIKESDRVVRNWLRKQIKIFGYTQIQKSLWVGPGPLPQSFLKKLKMFGIQNNVKLFPINQK